MLGTAAVSRGGKERPPSEPDWPRTKDSVGAHARSRPRPRHLGDSPFDGATSLHLMLTHNSNYRKKQLKKKGVRLTWQYQRRAGGRKDFLWGNADTLFFFFCPTMLQSPCSLPTGCMLAARPPHVEFTWLSPSQAGRLFEDTRNNGWAHTQPGQSCHGRTLACSAFHIL